HGLAGKTSCGEPMRASGMIGCSPSLRAWCSMGCLHYFPLSQRLCRCTDYSRKASTITEHLSLVSGVLPGGAVEVIEEQVNRILAKGDTKLSFAFASSLAFALWSANAGMKAVIDALNVAYGEKEKRGFIKLNLVSLALTG